MSQAREFSNARSRSPGMRTSNCLSFVGMMPVQSSESRAMPKQTQVRRQHTHALTDCMGKRAARGSLSCIQETVTANRPNGVRTRRRTARRSAPDIMGSSLSQGVYKASCCTLSKPEAGFECCSVQPWSGTCCLRRARARKPPNFAESCVCTRAGPGTNNDAEDLFEDQEAFTSILVEQLNAHVSQRDSLMELARCLSKLRDL